jgi:ABC-type branched-subunit amino acid transport system ATPase component/ABC-type branched-subunit amino acid transport system permease subunit
VAEASPVLALVGFPAQAVAVGALIGLAYALLGSGLVVVYRASRVINFAHGQLGALCGAVLAKLVLDLRWPFAVALVAVVALGGALGALIELTVVRRLFDAPRLQLFVATLGLSQLLLVAQYLLPDVHGTAGGSVYPTPLHWSVDLLGVQLASPELMMLLLAPVAVVGTGLFLTRSWSGLLIRASAENRDMAELSGISTRRTSTMVWVLAGGLAALTSVLLNPLLGTVVNTPSAALGPGLLLPALAAGLVGGLVSLPLTLAGGIAIGIVRTLLVVNFPSTPGIVDLVTMVAVLALVLLRPIPGEEQGTGQWSLAARARPVPRQLLSVWWVAGMGKIAGGAAAVVAVALPFVFTDAGRIFIFSHVAIVAIVGLSVTVLTGWAGQLSLGQYAFAGLGAVVATALVTRGYSFAAALGYAVVLGAIGAVIVGFPALRVSGLFLTATTLAFAVATQGWLLRLDVFREGQTGSYYLPRSELFGVFDLTSQRAYYFLCLTVLAVAVALTSRLRRTGIGRSLVAVRENEACAASFGVSPALVKLSAFAFAGGLAAAGGALFAGLTVFYSIDSIQGTTPFGPEQSLQIVAVAVIGGLGSVAGTLVGAAYVVGLPALFDDNPMVSLATSGIGLLLLLLYLPGGLASVADRLRGRLFDAALRRLPASEGEPEPEPAATVPPALPVRRLRDGEPAVPPRVAPAGNALDVVGVSVTFGGLEALADVHIHVAAGEVVGLIGSNGAGKSTLMNVISGHQRADAGTVAVWGDPIAYLAPHERARLGVGRVFQDARLFGDLTVRETVMFALEAHERSEFVPSMLGVPPSRRLERRRATQADEVTDFLGLARYADTVVGSLSTGTRRILELACLLAREPNLILLDEPTAGVAQREAEAFGPLIKRLQAELDATIVIIEHDMPLVLSLSDRVYCLDAGRVIAEGDADAIRNDAHVVAAYLGTDQRAIERSGDLAGARRA